MLAAILTICGATLITSCSSYNDDTPVTPVSYDVRMTKQVTVTLSPEGDTIAVVTQHITWEDGLLKKINATIRSVLLKTNIETEDRFVYEGKNCTEILHSTGTHDYFTYTDGRLSSGVSTRTDGTIIRVNATAYTPDGHISEMTREDVNNKGEIVKNSYSLTWENGDLKSFVKHLIDPAGDDVPTETYSYYDVPSPYTGYPIAHCIWDAYEIVFRGSKHFVKTGENSKFENGRIVAATEGLNTSYFTYSDGTGSTLTSAR